MDCVWMMRDHAVKQMLHAFSYSPTPLMATLKYHMAYGTIHAPELFPEFPKYIFQDAKASLVRNLSFQITFLNQQKPP